MHRFALACGLWGLTIACMGEPLRLYIAPGGRDEWSGQRRRRSLLRRAGPFRTLERARDEGRVVTVLYGEGGDEPPAPIDVLPLFLFARGGNHYLEGECQSSGLLKTYRLDRLRKVLNT